MSRRLPLEVLSVVFRHRVGAAFLARNRRFNESLLGKERADKLQGHARLAVLPLRAGLEAAFLLVFGLCWIAISPAVLILPLVDIGEWKGL